MAKIYFINLQDKKVAIEVSDEIAKQYRESLREEWRGNANEKYYTKSLDSIIEAGHDFADEEAYTEEILCLQETKKERAILINKLKVALPFLTDLQRQTIHKLFVLNMSQADIAKEEGVLRSTIKERVDGIFRKLKKLIEKK